MNRTKVCVHHLRELTRKKTTVVTSIEVLHLLQKMYEGSLVVEKIQGVAKYISPPDGCYCCLQLRPYKEILALLKQKRFINVSDEICDLVLADFEKGYDSRIGLYFIPPLPLRPVSCAKYVGPQEYLKYLLEGEGYCSGLPDRYRDDADGHGSITARDWVYYSAWYRVSIP